MSLFNSIVSKITAGSSGASGVMGVDIGSSSIKLIELQERNGMVTLTNYAESKLGSFIEKTAGEAVLLEAKQEQAAFAELLQQSAIQARNAIIAMPLSSSFVTNVSIEAAPDSDLAAMVRIEARKVIPASLSEVTLDWAEVEVNRAKADTGAPARRDVLIAAIQNTALERFKVLAQFVGLPKSPTEIECFSSLRTVYDSDESDVVVIDLGATSAKLYISRKGQLMRMHRIRAGGAVATDAVARALHLSFAEAEAAKVSADKQLATYPELKRVHNASYDRAFREFNQVLKEYEKKTGIAAEAVYLTGGASLFPGVDMHLKEVLGCEVRHHNPFSKVAYPAFMEDTLKEIGPVFSVALGAALRVFE